VDDRRTRRSAVAAQCGWINGAHAVVPQFLAQGGTGVIINVVPIGGRIPKRYDGGAARCRVGRGVASTDIDGELLDPTCAAVELLNLIRTTVAVAWFVTFTGDALLRWPEHRTRLRDGDTAYAVAFAHESAGSTRSRRSSAAGRSPT